MLPIGLLYNNIFDNGLDILLKYKKSYNILLSLQLRSLYLAYVTVFRRGAAHNLPEHTAEIGSGMVAAGFGNISDGFLGKLQHLAGVFYADMV